MKRILLYGVAGGILIALLKAFEYRHFVQSYPGEIYGGIIAALFAAIGIYFGRRLGTRNERVVIREVPADPAAGFVLDEATLDRIGLTAREHEILGLIAEGLSNREIGERLFVSENTIKTHSSRLFQKLDVSRRTQAVQRGKELGLIP